MWVILTIWCVWIALGGVLAGIQAVRYYRAQIQNSKKLAVLQLVRTALDLLSVATVLYLWRHDLVSEWWLVIAGLSLVAVYTAAFRFAQIKLETGKSPFTFDP